jgi:hypothetical protein
MNLRCRAFPVAGTVASYCPNGGVCRVTSVFAKIPKRAGFND